MNVRPKRASVHTVGCRLNQSETAVIRDKLRAAGYLVVPFGEEADLGIINTCTVTREADAKCRQAVRAFIRKNPNAFTAVVGCYAQSGFQTLAEIPGVDLIVGTQEKMNVLAYVGPAKNETPLIIRNRITRDDFVMEIVGGIEVVERVNLKIQDGCDFMCSFCAIPFARGRARSRQYDNLIEEARQLVARGAREIVLTGVNLGTYSAGGKTIVDVVDGLAKIPELARIRISSIEPTTIPSPLLERMAARDHPLVPFLHIPVQSGSDRVLSLMKRKYSRSDFLQFVNNAAKQVPNICIGTDILVGFPSESDQDFADTKSLLTDAPLAYAHVFTYSERRNTAASRIVPVVDSATMDKRSLELRLLSQKKRAEFYKRFLQEKARVLFESEEGGFWHGHTDNYIPVISEWKNGKPNLVKSVHLEKVCGDVVLGSVIDD